MKRIGIAMIVALIFLFNTSSVGAVIAATDSLKDGVAKSTVIVRGKVTGIRDAPDLGNVYGDGWKLTALEIAVADVYAGIAPRTLTAVYSSIEDDAAIKPYSMKLKADQTYVFFLREEYKGDPFSKIYYVPSIPEFIYDPGNARLRKYCAPYRGIYSFDSLKKAVKKYRKYLAAKVNHWGPRWRYPTLDKMTQDSSVVATVIIWQIIERKTDRVIVKLKPKALFRCPAEFNWDKEYELPPSIEMGKDYLIFMLHYIRSDDEMKNPWWLAAREGAVIPCDSDEGKQALDFLENNYGKATL